MLHPLFSTVIQRPDLVVDHLSAYAALLGHEISAMGQDLVTRLVAWVLFAVFGLLSLLLIGVALMLGFIHNQFHWMLVVVPGTALAITVAAFLRARRPATSEHFPELKAQFDSDAQALRMAA